MSGLILICKRYAETEWSLMEGWTNTNCIIHGGLSITGLAIVSTKMFQEEILLYYWMLVLVIFCLVEGLEIVRAVKRVRQKVGEKASSPTMLANGHEISRLGCFMLLQR